MKIMIIDGNSIVNRAFYGIRLLSNKNGVYTNAVYGFFSTYFRLFSEVNPDGVCVCFDLKAPTFRHKEFDVYKAGRRPMPEELVQQIPVVKKILDLYGVPRFELEGYEADDLIGTISKIAAAHGSSSVIVTGDRDSLQLIDSCTTVKLITTKAGQTITTNYDEQLFAENYCGLEPEKMIDIKALSGDKSDNIPGVAGIGDKTAMELLCKFRSLDGVYENIESAEIRESVRKKLTADKENAYLSYRLATIDRTAPTAFTEDMAVLRPVDNQGLYKLLSELELKSLISRMNIPPSDKPKNACGHIFDVPVREILSGEQTADVIEACVSAEAAAAALNDDLSEAVLCLGQVSYYISAEKIGAERFDKFLKELFGSDIKLVLHSSKPILRRMLERKIQIGNIYYDTEIAAYLLSPSDLTYPLELLAEKYLDCGLDKEDENAGAPEQASMFADDNDKSGQNRTDNLKRRAAAIYALFRETEALLKKQSLFGLMRDVEMPLVSVLAEMENAGVAIDKEELKKFGQKLKVRIDELTENIYNLAGQEFNINSTKALGEILFEKLGLNHIKKTKTGYSTDIDVLNKLKSQHEIIPLIIEYRELSKLMSTYVDGLMKDISQADGRIHTTFQQTVTSTGRLSSTAPNLQNIPVRKTLGAEIRRMFTAGDGCVLIDADYSQIELRVLAHVSADKAMIDGFISGEDVHTATAAQVFSVPLEQVTSKMRSAAKAVNFGIVYGISEFSLAEDIGVSRAEAKQYIENYLEKYSGIREYMNKVKEHAKEDGYVTTLFGRRRYLPELKSSNYNVRSFGERAAMNMPIQGTAADIIKIAMIAVDKKLRQEQMKTRLILQIHDELILEAPLEEKERAMQILKEQMENVIEMKVRLTVDISSGKNWFEAK